MKGSPLHRLIISLFLFSAAATPAFSSPPTISVLYFSNNSGDQELNWLQKGLTDMLLTDLALSEEILVVEREELERIINEQKFSLSGLADDNRQIEIGKLLAAEFLITGSFISSGGRLRIDGKILDTSTGSLVSAVKTEGAISEVFILETEIVQKIYKSLSITPPQEPGYGKTETLAAAEAYYTGLHSFDMGEYDKAAEYYRQASRSDPGYKKPREGLEASFRFLKDFRRMRQQKEINKLILDADVLRTRLQAHSWQTYADFLIQAYQQGKTDSEQLNAEAESLGLFSGDTPAVCAWNLQNILMETAGLALDNFADYDLAEYCYTETIQIAVEGRRNYLEDPFLPELIYQQLLALRYSEKYETSLEVCEELMLNYPEYRMMWAVEDFYEDSLLKISDN